MIFRITGATGFTASLPTATAAFKGTINLDQPKLPAPIQVRIGEKFPLLATSSQYANLSKSINLWP